MISKNKKIFAYSLIVLLFFSLFSVLFSNTKKVEAAPSFFPDSGYFFQTDIKVPSPEVKVTNFIYFPNPKNYYFTFDPNNKEVKKFNGENYYYKYLLCIGNGGACPATVREGEEENTYYLWLRKDDISKAVITKAVTIYGSDDTAESYSVVKSVEIQACNSSGCMGEARGIIFNQPNQRLNFRLLVPSESNEAMKNIDNPLAVAFSTFQVSVFWGQTEIEKKSLAKEDVVDSNPDDNYIEYKYNPITADKIPDGLAPGEYTVALVVTKTNLSKTLFDFYTFRGTTRFKLNDNGSVTILEPSTASDFKGLTLNSMYSDPAKFIPVYLETHKTDAMTEAMASAINWTTSGIQTMLNWSMGKVVDLLDNTSSYLFAGNIESAWVKMRDIGLSLLVLGLIIIAFANVFQIDIEKFGLNRMIPRIIIAIVLAMFSWIIFSVVFDLATAFQDQAYGLITSGNSGDLTTIGNLRIATITADDVFRNIGLIILLIIIFFLVLVSAVILLWTLLLRIVVLAFLLGVAPLAFMMMIMPFTETLYKKWWSEFWKWMFMGPFALCIIALGYLIATAMPGSNLSNVNTATGITPTPDITSGNLLISMLIFAASLWFAATLPIQWGGAIMKNWANVGKKAWGALYERSGVQGFVQNRKASIAGRSALRGRKLKSMIAGKEGNRLRAFMAGNAVFNKTMARANAQRDHIQVIQDTIKENGLDKMGDTALQDLQHRSTLGSSFHEAVFLQRLKNHQTNGIYKNDGEPADDTDQKAFNYYYPNNPEFLLAGRDLGSLDTYINSPDPQLIEAAFADLRKVEWARAGGDTTRAAVSAAYRAVPKIKQFIEEKSKEGITLSYDQAIETMLEDLKKQIKNNPSKEVVDTFREVSGAEATWHADPGMFKRQREQKGGINWQISKTLIARAEKDFQTQIVNPNVPKANEEVYDYIDIDNGVPRRSGRD